ncbi:hypothetical protein F5887DRAFT_423108 [Amanita rubescens]|nr:hypothetical protein F5887DRAFT_423108 [Amanita rubescens]
MALMKNLHTVQILCYRSPIRLPGRRGIVAVSSLYKDAFAGYRFPSVRRIVLSVHEVALFPCFPEAHRVYMALPYTRFGWDHSVLDQTRELASHCHKVHVFEWSVDRTIPWTVRKEIHDMLPSLRQVHLFSQLDTIVSLTNVPARVSYNRMQDSVKTLSTLKHLDTIVLTVSYNHGDKKRKEIEQMVLAAQAILTASPSIERKTLVVQRPHDTKIIRSF